MANTTSILSNAMYGNGPDPDMEIACSVTLNSLNVFACHFPMSRVNGVATGLASSSDKVVINASTPRFVHRILLCRNTPSRPAVGAMRGKRLISNAPKFHPACPIPACPMNCCDLQHITNESSVSLYATHGTHVRTFQ